MKTLASPVGLAVGLAAMVFVVDLLIPGEISVGILYIGNLI